MMMRIEMVYTTRKTPMGVKIDGIEVGSKVTMVRMGIRTKIWIGMWNDRDMLVEMVVETLLPSMVIRNRNPLKVEELICIRCLKKPFPLRQF